MQPLIIGLIYEGGPIITVPITLTFLAIVLIGFMRARDLFGDVKKPLEAMSWSLNAILALGGFAFVLGIFGQNLGFISAAQIIEASGGVGPSILAGGVKVALIAPTMGMSVLLIAGVIWFILKSRQQQLMWSAS